MCFKAVCCKDEPVYIGMLYMILKNENGNIHMTIYGEVIQK